MATGFGKRSGSEIDVEGRYAKAERPDYSEKLKDKNEKSSQNSDVDSDVDSDDDNEWEDLPISHQLILQGHEKRISSLSMDPSGFRIVTGSYDCTIRYWDFNGMNPISLNSFRSVEPVESHQVHRAVFSPTGDSVLVIPRSSKPKLYSRDGVEIGEFASGDQYLVDMRNTKGHVAEMTSGEWSPVDATKFITASYDSTIRIWDANTFRTQKSVIVVRNSKGVSKTKVSSVAWAKDGTAIIGATEDGSLSIWSSSGPFLRPSQSIQSAHTPDTYTSCILPSADGNTIVTRGGDGTLKVWDSRRFKTPVLQRAGLENDSEELNIVYSPDNRYLVTGTSNGKLHILDKNDLSDIETVSVQSPVTQVYWHPKINQILAGTLGGAVHVLFSRDKSTKGAKSVIERAPRVRHADEVLVTANISAAGLEESINYQQQRHQERRKRKQEEKMLSTVQNFPDAVNSVWGVPDKKHVEENVELSELNRQDPRESLLKYAEKAKKNPPKFFNAYKETQPEKIYSEDYDDVEDREKKKKLKIGK